MLDDASEMCRPFVHETLHYKTLHFSLHEAQSRMLKREPCTLVVDYTRTMMGFLLFNGQPQRVAMIGLGGGSLAKFCYRELPRTRIDVVEINPHVLALRDEFHVPPDDERFRVHLDDGAHFVRRAHRQFNVLLVDGYTREGVPAKLASQAFYDQCRQALCDNGIMVLNLYCDDLNAHLERIRRSFGRGVFTVCEADGTNNVVFAHAGDDPFPRLSSSIGDPGHLRRAAGALLKPAFSRVAAAMHAQCDSAARCD
ncbi:fused MFS/spermidine synthase [Tahibacter soli]|uniref:Fused MFS/spermidine synthase n=1 Tax=Tahibacter soli TaxID=2983605 RepID=A0A9X3YP90_9GAMM|nr:fused MFS/spermidine synthase [Tahibacter soli]MDC8015424.1 fused MFS/spermidine synthase [Tahibacter soli]